MKPGKALKSIFFAGTIGALVWAKAGEENGAIQFSAPKKLSAPDMGELEGVEVVDYDGDGVLDLAITCYVSNHVVLFQGLGDGKFRFVRRYGSGGRTPYHLAIADLDNDGWEDIVVGNYSGEVKMLKNLGGGLEFEIGATVSAFGANWEKRNEIRDVVVEDIDGDGVADIAIACASPDAGYLSILGGEPVGGGGLSFKPAVNHYLGFI